MNLQTDDSGQKDCLGNSTPQTTPQEREAAILAGTILLTPEELAERLHLSPKKGARSIREKVRNGTLPAIRINSRHIRFHWPTVIDHFKRIR